MTGLGPCYLFWVQPWEKLSSSHSQMVKSFCSPEDTSVTPLGIGLGSCEGAGKLNLFYLSMAPVWKWKLEWVSITPSFLTCHFLDTLQTLIYIKPYFQNSLQVEMSTFKRKKRSMDIGHALHHDPALRMSCGAVSLVAPRQNEGDAKNQYLLFLQPFPSSGV